MAMELNVDDAMSDSETEKTYQIEGRIKWFDPAKGYGFIVPNDEHEGFEDVLLHVSVLRRFGRETATGGMMVTCLAAQRDRGFQAVELLELRPFDGTASDAELIMTSVVVKWFDPAKGYGFVQDGSGDDIFIHMVSVREAGYEQLETDARLWVSIGTGPKGRHVTAVDAPRDEEDS